VNFLCEIRSVLAQYKDPWQKIIDKKIEMMVIFAIQSYDMTSSNRHQMNPPFDLSKKNVAVNPMVNRRSQPMQPTYQVPLGSKQTPNCSSSRQVYYTEVYVSCFG